MTRKLGDKASYGDIFFVPQRARWHQSWLDGNSARALALENLKYNIGAMLNKTVAMLEHENDSLIGVLKNNIDFSGIMARSKDQKWKDLLDHFHSFGPLVSDRFEYFADRIGKTLWGPPHRDGAPVDADHPTAIFLYYLRFYRSSSPSSSGRKKTRPECRSSSDLQPRFQRVALQHRPLHHQKR